MSDSILDRTVAEFLDDVAARTSAPGGGAVTAVAVSAAAALVTMAARFADGPAAEALVERGERLRAEVAQLADADADAYRAVLEAYRLPPEHPDRRSRITAALQRATEVPLRIAEAGAQVATMADEIAATGNRSLTGDARTAAELAASAARAAATLAEINIEAGRLGEPWRTRAQRHRPGHGTDPAP